MRRENGSVQHIGIHGRSVSLLKKSSKKLKGRATTPAEFMRGINLLRWYYRLKDTGFFEDGNDRETED